VSLYLVNKSEYRNLVSTGCGTKGIGVLPNSLIDELTYSLTRIDFSWEFGMLPAIQPSRLWNQECSAFFLPSKESVAMAPRPTSVLLVGAWSLILTDLYASMLPIDIFSSIRLESNATFILFLTARVRLLMEEPPRSTPGFRATAGEWPSAVTAANILAGTMKRCRLSSARENFGGFLLATLWLAKRKEHSA
jgi:hypothetical protein